MYLQHNTCDFMLSTVSSPSDYDTAPDMMEPVETCPAVPRSDFCFIIGILIANLLYSAHKDTQIIMNTVTGK